MIGLTLFGLIHLLLQRRGWFYHVYPLGIGLACWGAWSLASLPPWRAAVCLLATAITPVWLAQDEAVIRARMYEVLHSASAMQAALEDRLPRSARVQVLDSDYGAFLAMARAGMRQATPPGFGSDQRNQLLDGPCRGQALPSGSPTALNVARI